MVSLDSGITKGLQGGAMERAMQLPQLQSLALLGTKTVLGYYSSITRDSPGLVARRTLYMSRSSAEGIQKFTAFINYNKFIKSTNTG